MRKFFIILTFLFSFSLININQVLSNETTKKAEKLISDAEDAFAIGSKGHFKSLEDLLEVRKKLVEAKDLLSTIKNSEQNKATEILENKLEPLAKYIIEHSGLDPKH